MVEYGDDLQDPWTTAVDGTNGIVIVEVIDGAGEQDLDTLDVFLPTSLATDGKLFVRISATR